MLNGEYQNVVVDMVAVIERGRLVDECHWETLDSLVRVAVDDLHVAAYACN